MFFVIPARCERAGEAVIQCPDAVDADNRKAGPAGALFHVPGSYRDGSVCRAGGQDLARAGGDGSIVSIGIEDRKRTSNALTVCNAGPIFKKFAGGCDKPIAFKPECEAPYDDNDVVFSFVKSPAGGSERLSS